jgi:hypothetical protein
MVGKSAKEKQRSRKVRQELVGRGNVTASALSSVMHAMVDLEVTEALTVRQINSFAMGEYEQVRLSIDLPLNNGKVFTWDLCRFDLLVRYFVRNCSTFKHLMQNVCDRSPQLDLIVWWDEITPGNILRPELKRKFMCIFVTFRQFGSMIQNEALWLPAAVLRHDIYAKVVGGWSNCLRLFYRSMFLPPLSLATAGFLITELHSPRLVVLRNSNTIADADGIKFGYSITGAAGTVPCLLCKNITAAGIDSKKLKRASLANPDGSGYIQDVSCPDVKKFDQRHCEEIWQTVDALALASGGGIDKTKFESFQQTTGIKHSENSLIRQGATTIFQAV